MKKKPFIYLFSGILLASICYSFVNAPQPISNIQNMQDNYLTTPSGLKYVITQKGTGIKPKAGDMVYVHYTGTLEDGKKFDSSYDRGEPLPFKLGAGMVIKGWDEGIALLQEGAKARLWIPSNLAYGERGAGNLIAPNSNLFFDVELVKVEAVEVENFDTTGIKPVVTGSGLKIYKIKTTTNAKPLAGQKVHVHYSGYLLNGQKFDSSFDRGKPFAFTLGKGQVIKGWDEGIALLNVGETAKLVIPSSLGYGATGAGGGVIPPNADLIFDVKLLKAE